MNSAHHTMASAASYIHRCFLSDIDETIERQRRQHQHQEKNKSAAAARRLSPKRQKLTVSPTPSCSAAARQQQNAAADPPVFLRLMGTVVELLLSGAPPHEGAASNSAPGNNTIVLDDGTGALAQIQASPAMTTQIDVQPGMTLECIVRVCYSNNAATTKNNNVNQRTLSSSVPLFFLIAQQLVAVQDLHAETLRWLELTYRKKLSTEQQQQQQQQQQESLNDNTSNSHAIRMLEQRGYPCRPSTMTAEDLYYVILSDCSTPSSGGDADDDNNNQGIATSGGRGVSMEDLSACLDLPMPLMEGLIEELQISGQIYRNQHGNYLPL